VSIQQLHFHNNYDAVNQGENAMVLPVNIGRYRQSIQRLYVDFHSDDGWDLFGQQTL